MLDGVSDDGGAGPSGPGWRGEILALEAEGVVSRTFRRLDPDRQLAIAEALLVEAAEHGPHGIGMRGVAARAGVSVGSLYQYFPRREGMLDFAARMAASLLTESLAGYAEPLSRLPLPEALAAYLAGGVPWSEQHAALLRFFGRAAYAGGQGFGEVLVRPVAQAMQGLVRAILTAARERGELRADVDLDAAVRLVHAVAIATTDVVLVPGLNDYYLLVDERYPVGAVHGQAVDMICRAFGAVARAGGPEEDA